MVSPKSPDTAVTTVTVQGRRSQIDRKTYEVSKLPDNETGSAADLLAKIPGVVVDASGDVTYNGRAVDVYLNGHPSLILQGDNRAIALQSMPATYVGSIQIIPNPGAQINSSRDGVPVINIVTKRNLPAGLFGSWSATIAYPKGYSRAGPFVTYHVGKLTLMASINATQRSQDSRMKYRTAELDALGAPGSSNFAETATRSRAHGVTAYSTMEYDLTSSDVLTGDATYYDSRSASGSRGANLTFAPNGIATEDFSSLKTGRDQLSSGSLVMGWTHYGSKPDETLKVSANISTDITSNGAATSTVYEFSSLASNLERERVTQASGRYSTHQTIFNVDYNTPVGEDQLALGIEINQRSDRSVSEFVMGHQAPNSGTINPLLSSRFTGRQTQGAAYVTLQREFGLHLTALAGLRLESSSVDANQFDNNRLVHADYTQLNPSLFATYVLSPDAKFRFSYTHRLQLPRPYDLNPAVIYRDENHISSGSPTLKPQQIDAFDINYDHNGQGGSFGIHGFYQRNRQLILTSSSFVSDPAGAGNLVLQTTTGNFGQSDTVGLGLTWSKQITQKLSVNTNATLSNTKLETTGGYKLSIASIGGNFSVNYIASNRDFFLVSYTPVARSLVGDGESMPYIQSNFTYSRLVKRGLFLTIGASDFLRASRVKNLTRVPTYVSQFEISNRAPTFTVSLRQSFGGSKPSKASDRP